MIGTGATRRSRKVSAHERDLWQMVTRDVEPLPGRPRTPLPLLPMVPAATPVQSLAAPPRMPTRHPLPPLDMTVSPGIDRRTEDKFRRGRMEIEGRIDLHGMIQTEAHTALNAFIHRGWRDGRRMVLVITGKGSGSNAGVLRHMVPRWLNEPPLRPMVLAMSHAALKDGGEGALYVLLKRRREHGCR